MPRDLPYYCMYPADFETDENVKAMTDTELGFYLRCLNHSWVNRGLPAEKKERSRVMRVPVSYQEKMWARVGKCFEQSIENADRVVNRRQEFERTKAIDKSKQATKSVRTRYVRSKNERIRASDSESESGSDVVPGGGVEEGNVRFGTWQMDDSFKPVVELYQLSGKAVIEEDFADAWWAWKVLDFEQKAMRLNRLKYNIHHHLYSDPAYIPLPRKFVEKEWKRELRPVANGSSGWSNLT